MGFDDIEWDDAYGWSIAFFFWVLLVAMIWKFSMFGDKMLGYKILLTILLLPACFIATEIAINKD